MISKSKITILAAAYVRMSSSKQEASPDQQREEVAKLAEKHGYQIIREYFDSGISGDATEKRTDFLRMRDDAAKGDFEIVLAWDSSRIGRFDSLEGGYWLYPFVQAGVTFETVRDGRIGLDSFTSRIMFSVSAESNNKYLRDLAHNSVRGRIPRLKRGCWTGARPPFGYKIGADGRLEIDPETAPTVRRLFDLYASGKSLQEIVDILRADKEPSPGNTPWARAAVRRILKNEAYIGLFKYGSSRRGKYAHVSPDGPETAKTKTFGPRREPVFRLENAHPAIVTAEVFQEVQLRLVENRKHTTPSKKAKRSYVFAGGLLKCGACGTGMSGIRAKDRAQYICSRYQTEGSQHCNRYVVKEDDMTTFLFRKLRDVFAVDQHRAALAERIRAKLTARTQEAPKDKEAAALRRRLTSLAKKVEKGAERLLEAPSDLIDVLSDKLRQYRADRDEVAERLSSIENANQAPDVDVEAVIDRAMGELSQLDESFPRATTEAQQAIIRSFVDHIDLWFQRVPIRKGQFRCDVERGIVYLKPGLSSSLLVAKQGHSCSFPGPAGEAV